MHWSRTLHLLYELGYYISSVVISVADPVLDLIVGFNYLSNDDTVFGIATLILCLLPSILMSTLSFQWIVYDSTLDSMIKKLMSLDQYHVPQDYTEYFLKRSPPRNDSEETGAVPTLRLSGGYVPVHRVLNFLTYRNNEDVEMHSPETMDEIATDSGPVDTTPAEHSEAGRSPPVSNSTGFKWRHRPKRGVSEISVDAGISRYPLIITGTTIDGSFNVMPVNDLSEITFDPMEELKTPKRERYKITDIGQRKDVYKRTCKELRVDPVKPSWGKVRLVEILVHLLGLPGITRYAALFKQALRMHHKRGLLSDKYDLFVKEAAERGIKEVYFNKDLSKLYHGRRDAALLRLIEGSLESTPQLLLQLYIIVKYTQLETNWFTYLSVVISFTSVVWSMTSYIYEHRAASYDKGSMSYYSYTLTVLIKLCMCLSRISAILLAATYSGYLVLGVCLGHWITCLLYVCYAKTHFYGGLVWNEWFFKFIASITLVLTFMNIVEGNSFTRWYAYHSFTLLQNLGMLTCWYIGQYEDPLRPDLFAVMLISLVIGGMVLGALLTLLYYQCCHPSRKQVLDIQKIGPVLEELRKKHAVSREAMFETSL